MPESDKPLVHKFVPWAHKRVTWAHEYQITHGTACYDREPGRYLTTDWSKVTCPACLKQKPKGE